MHNSDELLRKNTTSPPSQTYFKHLAVSYIAILICCAMASNQKSVSVLPQATAFLQLVWLMRIIRSWLALAASLVHAMSSLWMTLTPLRKLKMS